jgi:hypothetical protein
MAELPEIKLDFGEPFANSLANMNQARYYAAHANALQGEEQRRQDAQQYVQPAMQGDSTAMGRLAAGDPKTAVAITTALQRMDTNQRAKIKEQAEYNAQASNAVLQAAPAERPQIYDQFYKLGLSRGYDMSHLPSVYTPQIDPFLRSTRMAAVPITEWFKTQEGMPQPMVPPGTGAIAGGGANGAAIAGVESAGQPNNGYSAVGPVANPQGDRAYGRYQVMGSNVGPWTQEVLGTAMTPQQFLANPQAQDKVFEAKFGQYVTKYGSPQAASRAWFAGEGGMNNPDATDVNGTTVAGYQQKFNAGLAPGTQIAGPPMAQGAPAANGPPVQLGGAPPAAPAAAPPAQAPAAPVQPAIDPNSPAARGGVPMGIKGVPVVKDGLQLFHMPDGQMEWFPVKGVNAFEDVKDNNGNIIGQRNRQTNQYHPIQPVPGASNIDPNLKGDDVYAALPPARAAEIRSIVNGDSPIPPPTSRAPYAQETRALVFQAAGPGFTDALHAQRMAMKKDMNTGKIGQALQAQGTLFNHMDHALDIADNLNNSPYPVVNKALNAVGLAQGDPRVVELEATKTRINQELEKYFAGHTTVSGLAEARNELNAAQSPEQIKAAIRTLATLVNGQQSELVHRINRGLGYTGDKSLTLEDPLIISPEGAKARDDVLARTQANPTANSKLMDKGKQFFGAKPPAEGPKVGAIEQGYRFKGGNPADKNSWEKVQ